MTNLTDKAMLVRVNLSAWSARKHDKGLSDEVNTNHGASDDAGRYNKHLMAKERLKAIQAADGEARTFHYVNTLPWQDDGYRLLPAANYLQYTDHMRKLMDKRESLVRDFVANYPAHVEAERIRLNGMFRASDYPTQTQIQADIKTRTESAIAGAVQDIWTRVYETVSHLSDRLKAYEVTPEGKVKNPFRDSLVENLRDLVDLLPRLNLTGDSALSATCQELKSKLCTYEPDSLRENDRLRAEVAKDADSILAAMAGYVSAA